MTDPTPLPPLAAATTPNQSARKYGPPRFLVWHATAGAYAPSIRWLENPESKASAHLVIREDGRAATQLVALERKAWHAFEYWNERAVGVEHASTGRGFTGREQAERSARVFAWLCHVLRIPPVHGIGREAGIVRHRDLGAAGGGHEDGPTDATWFGWYLPRVAAELERGGFRKSWASL